MTWARATSISRGILARRVGEHDQPAVTGPDAFRGGSEALALNFADRGVRSVGLRFAPTVHGEGDHGFVTTLGGVAEPGARGAM